MAIELEQLAQKILSENKDLEVSEDLKTGMRLMYEELTTSALNEESPILNLINNLELKHDSELRKIVKSEIPLSDVEQYLEDKNEVNDGGKVKQFYNINMIKYENGNIGVKSHGVGFNVFELVKLFSTKISDLVKQMDSNNIEYERFLYSENMITKIKNRRKTKNNEK